VTSRPDLLVPSRDGTPIAVVRSGLATGDAPTLLLVHGASADHTTWRTSGLLLSARYAVAAIDRRGRGASGDGVDYAIEREYEDVAAVADRLAAESGGRVTVVGHSYGGRIALGAALVSGSVGRVVCYEGAPAARGRPLESPEVAARLEGLAAEGRREELLVTFLAEVVGMTADGIEAYRANPVWPDRVDAALTIPREIRAAASPEAGLDTLGDVTVPVLQVLGSASRSEFAEAARVLDGRLPDSRVHVIDGAAHAAHHTHAEAFVTAVSEFAG
jgi:pimeloyl-ACP methyl ester carboxylesterase